MGNKVAIIWTADIPENRNTTRHQRARYLCENFDCQVFTTSVEVPDIIDQNAEVRTSSKENLLFRAVVLLLALYQVCLASREDYRVVHTNYQPPAAIIGFLCKLSGCYWIHDVWDHPALQVSKLPHRTTGFKGKIRTGLDTIVYHIANNVVATADTIVLGMHPDAATKLNLPEHKIVPIPNGTNVNLYNGIQSTNDATFTILYIGHIFPERGIETMLEAVASVTDDVDDVSLELIGKVPESNVPWLEREVQRNNLSNNVEIVGTVPHEEALQRIADADIGVCPFPRREELEYIYPIKLFEYMALGTVPVCTELTGIADVIDDGKNGFLFPPGNSGELEERLTRLERDEELQKRMAHEAKKSVKVYDWPRINERFDTVVRDGFQGS